MRLTSSTRTSLLVIALLAARTTVAGAQSPSTAASNTAASGSVRGSLADAQSGQPIDHASVAVRSGTTVVSGANLQGASTFNVQGLRPGTYTLRITSMGFSPLTREITVTSASPVVSLGTIKLTPIHVSLQTVQVSTQRAAVAMEADRTSYQTKQVAPAAANASEVLENVPAVQVDQDGTVSLRGNTNVVVQINGRPSPLKGTQLGSFLKTLPAGVVEHVEVVPNPSAKYDAEGMAGIINIVLKQNTDLGLSGGFDVAGSKQRYNGSGRLGYQAGPLTLSSSYGYNTNERSVDGVDDRTRYDASFTPVAAQDQLIASRSRNGGQNLTTSAEYRLNKRDVVTSSIMLNSRNQRDASTTNYADLTGAGDLLDRYDGLRDEGANGTTFDYDASFKRSFTPRKHELSFEGRFSRDRDQDITTAWRRDDPSGSAALSQGEIDAQTGVTKHLTLQSDYVRPVGKLKLETGVKSNTAWMDQDYAVQTDSLATGAWAPSVLSNGLRFTETVGAAYGLLSGSLGKAQLQGGLRGEYDTREFTLLNDGTKTPHSYGSLFPSANVMYNLSANDQFKLSYSRRIRRPGTQELNPFPIFFGAQNVFLGNASLNPEYTDAVEMGYTRSGSLGSLQINPFIRHTTDAIRIVVNPTDTVAGREVTTVSFHNLATANSWGTDLLGSLHFGSKVNGFVGANIFRMVTDGGSAQAGIGSSGTTWSARANLSATLFPTIVMQGSYFYRAPMNFEGGRFLAMQMTNFTLRKKLDGDNASIMFRVSDPFSTGRFRVYGLNGSVKQLTERSFGQRAAYVGFQYSYGKPPKIRQPEPQQQQQGPGFP
jgi:outer membrane receptor protein involved in Fe transport